MEFLLAVGIKLTIQILHHFCFALLFTDPWQDWAGPADLP